MILPFLKNALLLFTPLLIATLGIYISEKAGEFNFGMQGIVLTAAGISYFISFFTSPWIVLLVALIVGIVFGILISTLQVSFLVDKVVLGIAVFILGLGMGEYVAAFLGEYKPTAFSLTKYSSAVNDPFLYFSIALFIFFLFLMKKTKVGSEIKAIGHDPKAVDRMGIPVFNIKKVCLIAGCLLGALAGLHYVMIFPGVWVTGMTGGVGWMAIAMVRIGNWRIEWLPVVTFGFAFILATYYKAQVVFPFIPEEVYFALPYILAIVMMAMMSIIGRPGRPASLGLPYERE